MASMTDLIPSYDGGSQSWQVTLSGLSDGDVALALMIATDTSDFSPLDSHVVSSSGGAWTNHVLAKWLDTSPTPDRHFAWGLWSKVWNSGGGDSPGDVWGFKNDAFTGSLIAAACQGVSAPTWHLNSAPGPFSGAVHQACGEGSFLDYADGGGSTYHSDCLTGYFDLGGLQVPTGVLWIGGGFGGPSGPSITLPAGITEENDDSDEGPGTTDANYFMSLTDYVLNSAIRFRGHIRVSRG